MVARERGFQLAFLACSGAVTADLYRVARWPEEPAGGPGVPQLEQVKRLRCQDIRLVIVSIGGNDAGFADIGVACVAPGSCVVRGQIWLDRLANRVAQRAQHRVRPAARAAAGGPDPRRPVPAGGASDSV